MHDIIDNRNERLVDHVNRVLGTTEAARFAVGYFFLSGLTPISHKLAKVKELRLLDRQHQQPRDLRSNLPKATGGLN